VLINFLLILSNGVEAAASTNTVTNIGAIIDGNSRTGQEEKTAMEIAVQNFNNISSNHKLSTSSILKETLFKQLMQVNNLAISK
jgi:ionotropic glutamate receptor